MALNLPNFAGIKPESFLEAMLRGQKAAHAPQTIQNELESSRLINAINQYKLEHLLPEELKAQQLNNQMVQGRAPYAAQLAEAELENLRRQSQFGNLSGPAREALSLEMLKRQYGEDNPVYQNALRSYELALQNTESNIANRSFLQNTRPWSSLSKPAQENTLSVGRDIAPGLTDAQLAEFYMNGGTHEGLATMVGKSPEEAMNAQKKYAATNSTITAIQQGEGALAEDMVLGDFVSKGLGLYPRTFFEYSPAQIADAFKGDTKSVDKQARFLAARALASEQAAIRARLAGSSNASEALRDLKATSLAEFKILKPLVSPEIFAKTQKYIDETLTSAAKARFSTMRGAKPEAAASQNEFTLVMTPSGSIVRVPGSKLNEAVKAGGVIVDE